MPALWKTLDKVENPPYFLDAELRPKCYFAREYIAKGGYQASECNQLILNLKKPMSRQGTNEWRWKVRAIQQFVQELGGFSDADYAVMAIPTSKSRQDPEYDDRLDQVVQLFAASKTKIAVVAPIERLQTEQAHHLGRTRSIRDIVNSLNWVGFDDVPGTLLMVDDVITCGTNFMACRQMILQRHPHIDIHGAFWARTVHPCSEDEE